MALSFGAPRLRSGRRFDADAPLFWAFAALLVWAPIPLGSNRAWAWGFLEAAAFLLVAAWVALWAWGRTRPTEALRASWPGPSA